MSEFLNQSSGQFLVYLLILVRVSSILVFAPVFGSRSVPLQVKAGISLLLAVLLSMTIKPPAVESALGLGFGLLILGEVLIGAAVGYVANLIFEAIQLAGELSGLQMGFGIVNVIDPMSSVQVSLLGQLKFMLAVLLFLAINGHHMIVESIGQSFRIIPPGQVPLVSDLGPHLTDLFGEMLVLGVKLAAPVVVALLMASLVEGVIARTVPQINILIVGFGVRIAFGLFVLMLSIGFILGISGRSFIALPEQLAQLFGILRP